MLNNPIYFIRVYTPNIFVMMAASQLNANYLDINFDSIKNKITEDNSLQFMDKISICVDYVSDDISGSNSKAHMVIKKYDENNDVEIIQADNQQSKSLGEVISLGLYGQSHEGYFDYDKIYLNNPKKIEVALILNGQEYVKEINIQEVERMNKIK